MRAAILVMPLLLLTACKEEPRFEERYDKAAKEIEARAKAMDADIAQAEDAAKAADSASAETVAPEGKIARVAPEPLQDRAKPSNAPPSSGE